MSIAAGLTVLAGFALYWIDSSGFTSAWMQSGAGRGFGIGAAFGAIGFVYGVLIGRTTNTLVALGGQMQGKPSHDQMSQLQSLQKKQTNYSTIAAITLTLSMIFMSIARYFVF
jgi:Na+/glutamate symporter